MAEGLILAGRYQLISKLGSGGMGSVWRALDLTLKAEVAVKLIDASFSDSPEALSRFQREAEAAAAIRSTHVVQTLDYGIDQNRPFIAMELLSGESLAARLTRLRQLSPKEVAFILGHVSRALTIAHQRGIVHRDLKPENIFVVREDDEDIGKVLDFGIARRPHRLGDSVGIKTQTGAILGTPYYMSPEQATGQHVDHLTDIWSFGVIAFECITGQRAFESDSLGGLFHAVCMADLPTASRICPVPAGFDEWFARATARNKTERFQTIKEAADRLRVVCAHETTSKKPDVESRTQPTRSTGSKHSSTFGHTVPPASMTIPGLHKRNYARVAVVGTTVILVCVAATIYIVGKGKPPSSSASNPTSAAATVSLLVPPSANIALAVPSVPVTPPVVALAGSAGAVPEASPAPSVANPTRSIVRPSTPQQAYPTKSKKQPAVDDDNVAEF